LTEVKKTLPPEIRRVRKSALTYFLRACKKGSLIMVDQAVSGNLIIVYFNKIKPRYQKIKAAGLAACWFLAV
jgi:hypothetical protein